MTSKTEPLLPTADAPAEDASCGKVFALCISLIATTVGAGVLSVPISYAYVGSVPMGTAMLVFFGVLSAASLRFIDVAANLMNASSYLNLGERCFGRAGASAVLWSLLGLLGGAFVQLSIIVIDLTEMLLAETVYAATDDTPNRFVVTAIVLICAYPLCLPRQLLQLSFTSSLSVGCILFTCFCIISLSLDGEEAARLAAIRPAEASSSADGAEATPSIAPTSSPTSPYTNPRRELLRYMWQYKDHTCKNCGTVWPKHAVTISWRETCVSMCFKGKRMCTQRPEYARAQQGQRFITDKHVQGNGGMDLTPPPSIVLDLEPKLAAIDPASCASATVAFVRPTSLRCAARTRTARRALSSPTVSTTASRSTTCTTTFR